MPEKYPFRVVSHPVIDREAGTIGLGVQVSQHTTETGADRGLKRAVKGCLRKGASNVCRIIQAGEDPARPDPDSTPVYWFAAGRSRQVGRSIQLSLTPTRHRGEPLTIVEPTEGVPHA